MTTAGQLLERARNATQAGQFQHAESLYRELMQAVGNAPEPWAELGCVQLQLNRAAEAIESFERAATLAPNDAMVAGMLATAYRLAKRSEEAVTAYRRALELGPRKAEVFNNLALTLKDLGQRDEALATFGEALTLRPDYANGFLNRANLLRDMGRFEAAIDDYRRTLAIAPHDAGAHCALGSVYYDLDQYDQALEYFNRAIALDPKYAEPRRNRALIWLARGDFDRGWPEYEFRLACAGIVPRHFDQPRWDGTPLAGRTLLVYPEQGLGDALQFIRYLPWIERTGAKVCFEAPQALVPILSSSGFERFLVPEGSQPSFDVHASLLSLAGLCGEPKGQPYWPGAYLAAEPARVVQWRDATRSLDGFKIGINWAGNPDHPHDRYRSASLAAFAPLAAIEGVRLISLQKGPPRQQITQAGDQLSIVDFGEALDTEGAFVDTAAIAAALDLVVTVDTSIAHLAGGMGRDVWVALELSPDWRWRERGDRTPWYPSMRLFRQTTFDCWDAVFQDIAESVRNRLSRGA